eukprot:TRINITY_DN6734_c0_g1_i1.p1 TRINITY_DN6734_c0_g1~~TRINITY_DN6734_c0_g1_i1.p1  ORF type:complete len:222 (+),score=13.21 TRINITY_DN6734_c0_g1_i1:2-667(+)
MRRRISASLLEKKSLRAFICPITLDVYSDPVIAADGNTYERRAIEEWFQQSESNPRSPLTNEPLQNTSLTPNNFIRSILPEKSFSLIGDPSHDEDSPSQKGLCQGCNGTSACSKCGGKGTLRGINLQSIRCDECEGTQVCPSCKSDQIRAVCDDNRFDEIFIDYTTPHESIFQKFENVSCYVQNGWRLITTKISLSWFSAALGWRSSKYLHTICSDENFLP